MKNKLFGRFLLMLLLVGLTGCGIKYPELKKDAIAFQTSSYIDKNDDDASYLTFEYNGRTYLPYGELKGFLKTSDLDKCIGYIIQDEKSSSIVDINNKDTRIYTLSDDKENNFLMQYYIGTTEMNQPTFYRAIDTKGKDINIPKMISDTDHNYWK